MTLVHNDKIKEILLKERGKPGNGIILCRFLIIAAVISGELLIKGEINLVRGDRNGIIFSKVDFVDRFFQWGKVLLDGLIDQNITVGQIENFSL